MDASKQPPKPEDDAEANSLEGTSTIVEDDKKSPNTSQGPAADGKDGNVSDATGGKVIKVAEPPIYVKIWRRFNIYLLLFILVILAAITISVVMYVRSRNASNSAKDIINAQDLSEEALKQLANSSVTVGNSKQVLNIESNAIFAGAVLVRSNLEVAGTIKVGGELQLPGITVSGASRFSELQADNIAIGASATVQGTFTARNGLNVTGSSIFNGPISAPQITTNLLLLNSDLILTHHITAGGPIPSISRGTALGSGGTVSLSGSDTAGSITINIGSGPGAGCFGTVNFAKKFNGVPHVNITPIGSGAAALNYYVNRGTSEFSICTTNPAPTGQTFGFDYFVLD